MSAVTAAGTVSVLTGVGGLGYGLRGGHDDRGEGGLVPIPERGIVEARPPLETDKGTAVRTLVEEYKPSRAMYLGDDTTDLDAFRALEKLKE